MSAKENITDIIAKRNKFQAFINLNDRLKAESQNHTVDMTIYTTTQKLIQILNNKIMILKSLNSVDKSEPTIEAEAPKPIERPDKANSIRNILAIQVKNKMYFENSKNVLIETHTNVVNTLNTLINIQPNQNIKSELIERVTQTAANYLKIQNNIEFRLNKFIELQKKIISSIESNKDINTQKNISDSCIKQFNELKEFIIKCTSESREVFQILSVRLDKIIRQEAIKQEAIRQEAIKQEAIRQEAIRQEAIKQEAIRQEAIKQEAIRQEAIKQEAIRQEAIKQEAIRQEAIKQEAIRQEAIRQEAIRQEAIRQEAIRQEADKLLIEKCPLDFYNVYKLSDDMLIKINNNIKNFTKYIDRYKNILFICGDYPGYGGAATNSFRLSTYLENNGHNTYSIFFNYEVECDIKYGHFSNYCIIDNSEFKTTVSNLSFKPDLIILKSPIAINMKTLINNCPIYYLIGGIYLNDLDKNYNLLNNKIEQDKYINKSVLLQITYCDKSFCNSLHTQQILKEYYEFNIELFYSSFIQYYNENIINYNDFEKRKYEYGLIVSNFNRKIKNVEESIHFLKDKQNVILIGKGSSNYKSYGFECVELVEEDKMPNYYKDIKYIRQDSFYESCSNVKVEGLFNGCKIKSCKKILFASGDYPFNGGSATNIYMLSLWLNRCTQYDSYCIFNYIHYLDKIQLDPYNCKNVYQIQNWNNKLIKTELIKFLNGVPDIIYVKKTIVGHKLEVLFPNSTIYYLLSSVLDSENNWYKYDNINTNYLYNKELIPLSIKVLTENNKKIIVNSNLAKQILLNYNTNVNISIAYTSFVNNNFNFNNNFISDNYWNNRPFDICFISSSCDRSTKNIKLFIDIIKNPQFKDNKKCIIGDNSRQFSYIDNCTCVNRISGCEIIDYLKKTKLVIIPSKYDSMPNVMFEALQSQCNVLISSNVGGTEILVDSCIASSLDEFIQKTSTLIKNKIECINNSFKYSETQLLTDLKL